MKNLHWTDSEFDRTYFLWDRNLYIIIIITIISVDNAVYDSSGFSVFADSHLPFGASLEMYKGFQAKRELVLRACLCDQD